eukprot:gb/GECG01016725.1/.p1 GENE.gb/GECG01016725.1/~~gb/GECG01016725.1/.p1  ORF type:complete len:1284 (+),score=155.99 gb/GECG01016725.1/:1-3852(+)
MNLVGVVIPLIAFWPVLLGLAGKYGHRFPEPFTWNFEGMDLGEHSVVYVCWFLAYAGHLWATGNIVYEESTALIPEYCRWYQPFFNTLVLEQSLLYTRGDKPKGYREAKIVDLESNPGSGPPDRKGSSTSQEEELETQALEKITESQNTSTLTAKRPEHHVVLATCMWHEEPHEMEQWIKSLGEIVRDVTRCANEFYISPTTGVHSVDTYEAHIVVDGAFDPRSLKDPLRRLNIYSERLLNVIDKHLRPIINRIEKETVDGSNAEDPEESNRNDIKSGLMASQKLTEYGLLLEVDLIPKAVRQFLFKKIQGEVDKTFQKLQPTNGDGNSDRVKNRLKEQMQDLSFKFYIHLKDPVLTMNGKRIGQLLYMNTILGEVEKKLSDSTVSLERTLLVTTDGDTSFKYRDIDALVESMVRDEDAAGACGRIKPIGVGYMLPYQKFEYASGHWFQKTAEHVLGTVQCCPGCFSIWRMSRLQDILLEYSSTSEDGGDFLRKDLGEDRWMCTLLIRRGWRMRYCAAAEAYTFAPEDFDVFFEQRRRWLASTLANMWDLVLVGRYVSLGYGATGLPIYYRAYILMMFVLGLFTPSTVVLLTIGGLQLKHSSTAASVVGILLPLTYVGLVLWQQYRKSNPDVTLLKLLCYCNRDADVHKQKPPGESELFFTFKRQQLALAKILTVIYMGLLIAVLVGLLRHAISAFLDPDNLFFVLLVGLFLVTFVLHPRDMKLTLYGIIYFLLVPMGYLVLYMYAMANMNVKSWGTRGGKALPNLNSQLEVLEDPVATDIMVRREAKNQVDRKLNNANHESDMKISDINRVMSESFSRYFAQRTTRGNNEGAVQFLFDHDGSQRSEANEKLWSFHHDLLELCKMRLPESSGPPRSDNKDNLAAIIEHRIRQELAKYPNPEKMKWTHADLEQNFINANLHAMVDKIHQALENESKKDVGAEDDITDEQSHYRSCYALLSLLKEQRRLWRRAGMKPPPDLPRQRTDSTSHSVDVGSERMSECGDVREHTESVQEDEEMKNYIRQYLPVRHSDDGERNVLCWAVYWTGSDDDRNREIQSIVPLSSSILQQESASDLAGSDDTQPSLSAIYMRGSNFKALIEEAFLDTWRCAKLDEFKGYGQNLRDNVLYPYEENFGEDFRQLQEEKVKRNSAVKKFSDANRRIKPDKPKRLLSKEVKESLDSMRNNVSTGILVLNVLWIVAILIVSLVPAIRVDGANVAGLVFLGVCALLLTVQFFCMLKHRWHTFEIIVSMPLGFETRFHRKTTQLLKQLCFWKKAETYGPQIN